MSLLWMFAALIMISSFTAAIASSLTLGELQGPIQGADDLGGHAVATVEASTSAAYLERREIGARSFTAPTEALAALEAGTIEAFVYDAPLLRYLIQQGRHQGLTVLPSVFEEQHYAFALPPGSPHREAVNRAILEFVGSPEWERIVRSYLGE